VSAMAGKTIRTMNHVRHGSRPPSCVMPALAMLGTAVGAVAMLHRVVS